MTTLRLELELLTPAYAGGARGGEKATPSDLPEPLRGPVLKNLLRFWWRTLHPGLAPKHLFAREERIFGSANPSVGQRLRVVPERPFSLTGVTFSAGDTVLPEWKRPYVGYGVQERERGVLVHSCPGLLPGGVGSSDWVYVLNLSRCPGALSEIAAAAWMLSAFGGFGRRSRRGFGALRITSRLGTLPAFQAPTVEEARKQLALGISAALKTKEGEAAQPLPAHSAFGPGWKALVLPGDNGFHKSGHAALKELERSLQAFRKSLVSAGGSDKGWRKRAVAAGQQGGNSQTSLKPPLPLAAAYGLPLPGSMKSHWAADVAVEHRGQDRAKIDHRASPFLASISKWGKERFLPTLLYLPGEYLPEEARLKVQVREPDATGKKPGDVKRQWPADELPPSDEAATHFLDWLSKNAWQGIETS